MDDNALQGGQPLDESAFYRFGLSMDAGHHECRNAQFEAAVTVLSALGAASEIFRGTDSINLWGFIVVPEGRTLQDILCEFEINPDEIALRYDQYSAPDQTFSYAGTKHHRHIAFHGAAMPNKDETIEDIGRRIGITEERFWKVQSAWRESNGNLAVFKVLTAGYSAPAEPVKFVIEGLLLAGAVSLLVGQSGIGKSTLALQISCSISTGEPFCGLSVTKGRTVYWSGEDSAEIINMRILAMTAGLGNHDLLVFDQKMPMAVDAFVAAISRIENISLIVVDTASAFCSQTNDTAPVREFMGTLARFAASHGCAILVVHHINKSASNHSSKAVYDGIKGSGEFSGAARTVLTFHAEKNIRVLDIRKHNLAASIRRLSAPLRLQYDPATEMHEPIGPPVLLSAVEAAQVAITPGQAPTSPAGRTDAVDSLADAQTVATVVNRRLAEGGRVAVTGVNEPYTIDAPELAGWPRSRVRAAHKAAIEAGLIAKPSVVTLTLVSRGRLFRGFRRQTWSR